jgi:hypothetical protein
MPAEVAENVAWIVVGLGGSPGSKIALARATDQAQYPVAVIPSHGEVGRHDDR